jgi:Lon protease-like protein
MGENERTLPIFPLENVVLFPRLRTPLHVFEPRYRQLTEDALAADCRIVMAVVRPDQLAAIAGDPPVFPIACAGIIREHRRLPDGRFDILVHGSARVRILEEPARPSHQLYRRARVALLEDFCDPEAGRRVAAMRPQVLTLVGELLGDDAAAGAVERFRDIDAAGFVNALCNALPLAPPEKQGLLEADAVSDRCERLIEILKFAVIERRGRRVPNSGTLH